MGPGRLSFSLKIITYSFSVLLRHPQPPLLIHQGVSPGVSETWSFLLPLVESGVGCWGQRDTTWILAPASSNPCVSKQVTNFPGSCSSHLKIRVWIRWTFVLSESFIKFVIWEKKNPVCLDTFLLGKKETAAMNPRGQRNSPFPVSCGCPWTSKRIKDDQHVN